MKQTALLILSLGLVLGLQAQKIERTLQPQYSQGKWLIGTSASYQSHFRSQGQLFYDIDGHIRGGYFLKDKLVVGIGITKTMSFANPSDNTFYQSFLQNPTNFQAFSRYYFIGNRKVNLYGEIGGGLEYIRPIRNPNGERLFGGSIPNVYAEIGASIPLGKKVSIDLGTSLSYRWAANSNSLPFNIRRWTEFKLGVNLHL